MVVLNILKVIGTGALRLMTMGALYTGQNQLQSVNRNMSNDFNKQIGGGYNHYVKPGIDRGLRLVKRK